MNRKLAWTIGGMIVLAVAIVGMTQLKAQRPPPPREEGVPLRRPGFVPGGPVGRYMVARIIGSNIVLLDTMTGELYEATPKDFKKFSERPRGAPVRPGDYDRLRPDGRRPREGATEERRERPKRKIEKKEE
jgi:hypothetical protein